jgi:hypothetical protein
MDRVPLGLGRYFRQCCNRSMSAQHKLGVSRSSYPYNFFRIIGEPRHRDDRLRRSWRFGDAGWASSIVHTAAFSVRSCRRRTMIELDPTQLQAVAQGQPVRIIDPLTHDAYVVVRAEDYARLTEAPRRPAGQSHPQIPPVILRSQRVLGGLARSALGTKKSSEVGGVPRRRARRHRAVGGRRLSGMLPSGAQSSGILCREARGRP